MLSMKKVGLLEVITSYNNLIMEKQKLLKLIEEEKKSRVYTPGATNQYDYSTENEGRLSEVERKLESVEKAFIFIKEIDYNNLV